MTFSIIGTGNIAWFYGKRLAAAGHRCKGIFARDSVATKELADALLSSKYGAISDIRDEEADVCFLAVSDRAIAEVAKKISFKKTVLVHCAGAQDLDIISASAPDHAVLWPVYSILRNSLPAHRDIPCAWEASTDKARRYLLEMAHAITDNLFEAKGPQRRWLHLSAVFTNNFVNHLMAINEQICRENDLPASTLQPIINQTFDKLKHSSPFAVQTGPAIRKDMATVEQHKALLSAHPAFLKVYEALTDSILEMYRESEATT